MANDKVIEFTDDNFNQKVLESDQPVLVDFWAEWCQPCRLLGPTIDELADEYDGRVSVGKIATEANRTIPVEYGIAAIPTIMLFKGGEVVHKFVGVTQKQELADALEVFLSAP